MMIETSSRGKQGCLTNRQRAVLQGLAAGFTFAEIADRLGMSPATVAFHRRQIGLALGLTSGNIVLLLRAAVAEGKLPADVLRSHIDAPDNGRTDPKRSSRSRVSPSQKGR